MTPPTREELELYVMGEYDGDPATLEDALAADAVDAAAARGFLADEARFEALLREAGAAARFCPGCTDLVRGPRCDACGAALEPGGYVVERVLVQNAHGRMYVARDADGKQVALKELAFVQAPSLAAVAAFEREARILRALEHPAIPRFVASFEEGAGVHTRYYLAQELVAGRSLAATLDDHWFTEAEIRDLARQVLTVLVYLQDLSPMVIDRDIKPSNLVKRADGTIAVVDFGAAHVQGTTAGSTLIGTFGYMPIEQLAGLVDATTDPFALGASLLHLLSRQEPWRIVQSRHLDSINVSAGLRAFLARLVAPEPADRFPNAAAALAALDEPGKAVALTVPTGAGVPARRLRGWRRPAVYASAALLFMGLGAGGFHAARRMSQGPSYDEPAWLNDPPGTGLRFGKGWAGPWLEDSTPIGDGERPPAPEVDLQFRRAPIGHVLRLLAQRCGINVHVPDHINAEVDVDMKAVPCDQALETILQTHGLWYEYRLLANTVLIAPRAQLEQQRLERARGMAAGRADDPLPLGPRVDLDFDDAPLPDILRIFAEAAQINIVTSSAVRGGHTIDVGNAPWANTLKEVLESHGLWYRYQPNGKILRIAPRAELDAEDRAARERPGTPVP